MSTTQEAGMKMAIGAVVLWVLLFLPAGDLAWRSGWFYMLIIIIASVAALYGPLRLDEGLLRERMSKPKDTRPWDRVFLRMIALLSLAELLVPALDHRFGWSHNAMPGWLLISGGALVVAGTALLCWSMHANRFFSMVVRIQHDRCHEVVATGPYRVVRHPGYATWGLRTLGVPLLLGSYWAFIPAALFLALFAARTALEDQMLCEQLPGYRDYAEKVKWCLVPGVW